MSHKMRTSVVRSFMESLGCCLRKPWQVFTLQTCAVLEHVGASHQACESCYPQGVSTSDLCNVQHDGASCQVCGSYHLYRKLI